MSSSKRTRKSTPTMSTQAARIPSIQALPKRSIATDQRNQHSSLGSRHRGITHVDAYTNTTAAVIGTRPGPGRCMPLGESGYTARKARSCLCRTVAYTCNVHASHTRLHEQYSLNVHTDARLHERRSSRARRFHELILNRPCFALFLEAVRRLVLDVDSCILYSFRT